MVSGDAMVYGNARVFGDAMVYGNAEKSPIYISSLKYPVTITDTHLKIGCEFHTFEKWQEFDDKRIIGMDGKDAVKWWKAHKPLIMGIIEENRK